MAEMETSDVFHRALGFKGLQQHIKRSMKLTKKQYR